VQTRLQMWWVLLQMWGVTCRYGDQCVYLASQAPAVSIQDDHFVDLGFVWVTPPPLSGSSIRIYLQWILGGWMYSGLV
jgi:hypothetical protein